MATLREVAGRLQSKVKQTTRAINQLHNLTARTFPELAPLAEDLAAGWVLKLLARYPTAERVASAHPASLEKIPHLCGEKARAVHEAAKRSVASLRGESAEALVREHVAQVRHCQAAELHLRHLLVAAFADLPDSPHAPILTIPGIGDATAAALVAKVVDIDRFETPDHLVGYLGVFPEESSSGVDKRGRPLPAGTLTMSPQGQRPGPRLPLERGAKRQPAQPRHPRPLPPARGQGQARRRRDRPLHAEAAPPRLRRVEERSGLRRGPLPVGGAERMPGGNDGCARRRAGPRTTRRPWATSGTCPRKQWSPRPSPRVGPGPAEVKPAPGPRPPARPGIDFAYLREQVTMEQVLEHLGAFAGMGGRGRQRRGPCPVHGTAGDGGRAFSVNLDKNIFQCFHAGCGLKGNVLDLWAAVHRLPIYEAALHLAGTFHLALNREEEPVMGTRRPRPAAGSPAPPRRPRLERAD